MTERIRRFPEPELLVFCRQVFERLGMPTEAAGESARSLCAASMLGIDSHGVESLDMYANHLMGGGMDPRATPRLVHEFGGLSLWDMCNGPGLSISRMLMRYAIGKARSCGLAAVACRNTNHFGACGVYSLIAAEQGMIGVTSMQTRAMFAPPGGFEKRVGQSPLAVAAPVKDGFPFCFDASMASITNAAMKKLQREGKPLPAGIALDEAGQPTTDPSKAWFGQVLPIGGHKGAGLAMALEVLHCVLSGNIFANQMASPAVHPEQPGRASLFMLALAPDLVTGDRDFAADMRRYVDNIESSPPPAGGKRPFYPGKDMGERREDRQANGIPVSDAGLERLNDLARKTNVRELGA